MNTFERFAGVALSEREENRYSDSWWHLTWWNVEAERVEETCYGTTACAGEVGMSHDTLQRLMDQTPEGVRTAAANYKKRENRAASLVGLSSRIEAGEAFKGDTVEVFKGRKVAKGTRGRVINVEEKVDHVSRYGTWTTVNSYLLIDTGAGFVKVNAANCRVLERGPIMQDLFDLAN